jgi:hypothetical protein
MGSMTPFHLLVLAIGVFRATRFVTADTLTDSFREHLRERTHRTMTRATGSGAETRVEERTDRFVSLFAWKITSCVWCSSVWLSGIAIAAFVNASAWTLIVAYVLAVAGVAGFLAERS